MSEADVWIAPDLPLPSRAEKRDLLGLKSQMVQWNWRPFEINVDLDGHSLAIKDFVIATIAAHHHSFDIRWAPDWEDKLKSEELSTLVSFAERQMAEHKKGKGKGS